MVNTNNKKVYGAVKNIKMIEKSKISIIQGINKYFKFFLSVLIHTLFKHFHKKKLITLIKMHS